jgi:aryl-alcohol dehydrogenase-like predicted oxidoreductase
MSIFNASGRTPGFGCMGITAFYGAAMEDEKAVALMRAVFDRGCKMFDTAEIYRSDFPKPPNENSKWNEEVVGKFIATVDRSAVKVATKYMPMGRNGDLKCVTEALDASLARLGTDYVDVYYLHRMPSDGLSGLLRWMHSCKQLVTAGKIRNIGLSEVSPDWLRQAHNIHPVHCIQQEWSLLTRNAEESLIPTCAELGVGFVAYSPLARNLLSDDLKAPPSDWRATNPRYSAENFAANRALLANLESLRTAKNASTTQLSLAFLYKMAEKKGLNFAAIPGTTKIANFESNYAALAIDLSDDEMSLLSSLADNVAGARGDAGYIQRGFESQL